MRDGADKILNEASSTMLMEPINQTNNGAHAKWSEGHLDNIVQRMMDIYDEDRGINKRDCNDLPNIKNLYDILDKLFEVLFPGIRGHHQVTHSNLRYHIGSLLDQVHQDLTQEVDRAIRYDCRMRNCDTCHVGHDAQAGVSHLLDLLPHIREILMKDVVAAMEGDPASRGMDHVILSYPCIEAITTYRLAHELYEKNIPLIPRIWSERAHSRTGIDINPGADIGPSFFIDHGTGVVIGETTKIGSHVSIYQGVTLGALAPAKGQKLAGVKRHPTIEDNVIIYAGATILGGDTVIGEGSVIGGNVWLTESVPPHTKVLIRPTDLIMLHRNRKAEPTTGRSEGKEETPVVENQEKLSTAAVSR